MNDKEWGELWDNEPDDDEDDIASDIDANNDETFDNVAEWNEDEHEELIARDSILSGLGSRQILRVDELEKQLLKTRVSNNHQPAQPHVASTPLEQQHSRRSGWSPFGGKDLFNSHNPPAPSLIDFRNQDLMLQGLSLPANLSSEQQQMLLQQQRLLQQQQQHIQQQMAVMKRQELLQQQQQMEQQLMMVKQQQQQLERQHQITLQQLHQHHHHHQQQPQQQLYQQQLLQQQRLQQQTRLQQQRQQQQRSPHRTDPRLLPEGTHCITVEELERQMLGDRQNQNNTQNSTPARAKVNQRVQDMTAKPNRSNDSYRSIHDRRENERHERFDRDSRDTRDGRDGRSDRDSRDLRDGREGRDYQNRRDYKDKRDHKNGREHQGRHYRKESTIVPPQVQLRVIDKAKRLYSITAMHTDEFLQDRLPNSEHGFLFKRHSTVSEVKPKHDGVLTASERSWLTRIQEKIQADYDDNLDQDYYYLLYFNQSSMTDEAAQKPCGPGVLDRRFIPRERLLYNSSS